MKVATWNVNGIRARESQFVEWVRRDRPDVVCLQEIKATPEQLGESLTLLPEYWNYWHGGPKGYSGVSLHLRKEVFSKRPTFGHPEFDVENRVVYAKVESDVVFASVYVPNGGKDYPAKLRFLEAMRAYVDGVHAAGGKLVLCGDLNVARADIDVHPKERKAGAMGQRPEERDLFERVLACDLDDVARVLDPTSDTFHLVAALAQHAAEEPGLADRLRARKRAARDRHCRLPGAGGRRDERPRARHGDARSLTRAARRLRQRLICIPSSTTRSGGIPKY